MAYPETDISEFISLLTKNQSAIFAFLRTLLPNPADAEDVLQETNIALWKSASSFVIGTNFYAFATRIAYNKAIDHARRSKKLGGLLFDSDLMDRISSCMQGETDNTSAGSRQRALETCVAKLSPSDRDLVQLRYFRKQSIRDLVSVTGKSETNLQYHFGRIRSLLRDCIESKTANETA